MNTPTSFPTRMFQVWIYTVGHQSLLIRSPIGEIDSTNIDLIMTGVKYMALPTIVRGLYVEQATAEEVREVSDIIGKQIPAGHVRILVTGGQRFIVVASSMQFSENENDFFSNPFDLYP